MVRARPLEQKTEAIFIYAEVGRNLHQAERVFNERYPDNPICRKYLRKLVTKFQTTGSLSRQKGSDRKLISEDKQKEIVGSVVNTPQQSTAALAGDCDVAISTVKKY
ncbi:unnamed protein product [Brassicogethes aeneus]|uniref:DUF4817 domain-containing protein n=1 Tax=Brassicogethes aeneus TaxID=1431903 RepID=A0A9P0FKJ7_BRAAE|nr:unnamed protein product [Brassicogethes aeneus]